MSEWASVRSSNYSTGYSPRGGQVRNPYNLSSSPCKLLSYLKRMSELHQLFSLLTSKCFLQEVCCCILRVLHNERFILLHLLLRTKDFARRFAYPKSVLKGVSVSKGHCKRVSSLKQHTRIICVNPSFRTKRVKDGSSTDMIPDGSSSGSAVAVSANIVPLSFGTETDTSIIGPASINGIVGIKPTVGLTSRAGVIPISKSMDTVGSFGRTVVDAVHGLNAIVGTDERDAMTGSSSRLLRKDYSKYLTTKASLKGARFGLPNKRCWDFVTKDVKETALKILEAIREAGASVVEVDFPCAEHRIPADGKWDWTYGKPSESEFSVVKVEAFQGLNSYLSELSGTRMKTLEDVIEYNQENSGTEGAKPGDHPAFPTGQVSHGIN